MYFGFFSALMSMFNMAVFQEPMRANLSFADLGIMILISISGASAQFFIHKGVSLENAGRAASINYIQVVMAFIADIAFFN